MLLASHLHILEHGLLWRLLLLLRGLIRLAHVHTPEHVCRLSLWLRVLHEAKSTRLLLLLHLWLLLLLSCLLGLGWGIKKIH